MECECPFDEEERRIVQSAFDAHADVPELVRTREFALRCGELPTTILLRMSFNDVSWVSALRCLPCPGGETVTLCYVDMSRVHTLGTCRMDQVGDIVRASFSAPLVELSDARAVYFQLERAVGDLPATLDDFDLYAPELFKTSCHQVLDRVARVMKGDAPAR